MKTLTHLFENNRAWSDSVRQQDPEFFTNLTRQQAPDYLWIGCSDSRVPANQIVGLAPGELFVHRNVANVVVHADLNCLSVIQFAVEWLRVKHIIVCGHYRCGGVSAALQNRKLGLVDNWLRHVQDVSNKHSDRLARFATEEARVDRLCELNSIEQALNVCQTTVVQGAWERGQPLCVHAWTYSVADGLLHDLAFSVTSHDELLSTYATAVEAAS